MTRRRAVATALSAGLIWSAGSRAWATESLVMPALPTEVAGVAIPQSDIALRAAALSRSVCPEFLFNHSMRTFLFGAVVLNRYNVAYNADEAFVGAALHDVGLLPRYASPNGSFETDGAGVAQAFARANGLNAPAADVIWHSVALHDSAEARRYSPEARLVAVGAGSDVDGPGAAITPAQTAEILAAFPRLHFKAHFSALVVDHCRRKPRSQIGTWLGSLCARPTVFRDSVVQEITQAPFAE